MPENSHQTLAPFDIAPLDPESFEDKYRLALPWIRGEAGKIHALCSILSYMSPREKGAEQTRYLLVNLSEIILLIHKLCHPVDSKVCVKVLHIVEKAFIQQDEEEKAFLSDLQRLVADVLDEVVGVDERINQTEYLRREREGLLHAPHNCWSQSDQHSSQMMRSKVQGDRMT